MPPQNLAGGVLRPLAVTPRVHGILGGWNYLRPLDWTYAVPE